VFTDKDWEGIVTIYNSIKEEDRLKVGRFGLGFKSVFHMTGTVLSNNLYYVTLIFRPLKNYKAYEMAIKLALTLSPFIKMPVLNGWA
jgi:hypothetical protein